MGSDISRVTIVGGGVAALESLIGLRSRAGKELQLELVTPEWVFTYRPLAVAEPFGKGRVARFDLGRIAREHHAVLHLAGVRSVDPAEHSFSTWDGRTMDYELLIVAIGAQAVNAVPGSLTFGVPGYSSGFGSLLRDLDDGRLKRLAFAVPAASSWPLPLYELALMTASRAARQPGLEIQLVTFESEPLELFGPEASDALRELLSQAGIDFRPADAPLAVRAGELLTAAGDALPVDRVVSLPTARGPALEGLPHDGQGFISVDRHGRVEDVEDVYAAGDVTTFPIKQGGIAAQQADAVVDAIAAHTRAAEAPDPGRPVLHGLLLTGGAPRYLRTGLPPAENAGAEVAEHALWWPPGKITGRHLAPYLALGQDDFEAPADVIEVRIELEWPLRSVHDDRVIHPGSDLT